MLRNIYIGSLFFYIFFGAVVLMAMSFVWPIMMLVGLIVVLSLILLTLVDFFLVQSLKNVKATRFMPQRFDLNECHSIKIEINNQSAQPIFARLYDYVPTEVQNRKLYFDFQLMPRATKELTYNFTPKSRGIFSFGKTVVYLRSFLNLVQLKLNLNTAQDIHVYPSIKAMKKMEFEVFTHQSPSQGIKKVRRIGHNSEFEQIKNYVQGDEIKTINWKATSKRNELMVNQYQAEKSQAIYTIIDKSRSMRQEFEGMTLLDYAINSTLVFSNVAIKKGDRFGLISFSDKVDSLLAADNKATHLRKILDLLYNEKSSFLESDYEFLYQVLRKKVTSRATFILYTNFETEVAMRRVLPILRQINKKHNLVVVFFENTELENISLMHPENARDVYMSQIAQDIMNVKKRIAEELNRNGIQTVVAKPDRLSVETVNKYLLMKAKGLV